MYSKTQGGLHTAMLFGDVLQDLQFCLFHLALMVLDVSKSSKCNYLTYPLRNGHALQVYFKYNGNSALIQPFCQSTIFKGKKIPKLKIEYMILILELLKMNGLINFGWTNT